MITYERCGELFDYNYLTGELIWKVRTSNRIKIGSVAGNFHPATGYITIRVDGKAYGAHILVWLYVMGELPKGNLDHANRTKTDNRIWNLRDKGQSLNMFNTGMWTNNTSGVKGLNWHQNRWYVRLGNDYHGQYKTKIEAICARVSAETNGLYLPAYPE